MRTSVATVLTLVLTAGCAGIGPAEPVICTSIFLPGITVHVQDATTGAPIAKDARLWVTDGAYADSSYSPVPNDAAILWAAGERAGVYTATVRKPGYVTWTRSGVEVTKDECHVRTVSLTAALSKE